MISAATLAPTINIFALYILLMNRKTTLAFSTTSTVALVLLFAFGPTVVDHQALALGWYDGHQVYYGPSGGYWGQPCYYGCYGSSGYHP